MHLNYSECVLWSWHSEVRKCDGQKDYNWLKRETQARPAMKKKKKNTSIQKHSFSERQMIIALRYFREAEECFNLYSKVFLFSSSCVYVLHSAQQGFMFSISTRKWSSSVCSSWALVIVAALRQTKRHVLSWLNATSHVYGVADVFLESLRRKPSSLTVSQRLRGNPTLNLKLLTTSRLRQGVCVTR